LNYQISSQNIPTNLGLKKFNHLTCRVINLINNYHVSNFKLKKLKRKEEKILVFIVIPTTALYGVHPLFVEILQSSTIILLKLQSQ